SLLGQISHLPILYPAVRLSHEVIRRAATWCRRFAAPGFGGGTAGMRLCFILEAEYEHDEMPRAVADCLLADGHVVDLLEPHTSITNLSELGRLRYDAYVPKDR